jgi:hypothetical protein
MTTRFLTTGIVGPARVPSTVDPARALVSTAMRGRAVPEALRLIRQPRRNAYPDQQPPTPRMPARERSAGRRLGRIRSAGQTDVRARSARRTAQRSHPLAPIRRQADGSYKPDGHGNGITRRPLKGRVIRTNSGQCGARPSAPPDLPEAAAWESASAISTRHHRRRLQRDDPHRRLVADLKRLCFLG